MFFAFKLMSDAQERWEQRRKEKQKEKVKEVKESRIEAIFKKLENGEKITKEELKILREDLPLGCIIIGVVIGILGTATVAIATR